MDVTHGRDGRPGAKTIAATTSARNARHFATVVISWNRLLTRSPASCNAISAASVRIAIAFSYPPSVGRSRVANSPIALHP